MAEKNVIKPRVRCFDVGDQQAGVSAKNTIIFQTDQDAALIVRPGELWRPVHPRGLMEGTGKSDGLANEGRLILPCYALLTHLQTFFADVLEEIGVWTPF